jgi:hypothetical protein
MLWTVAGAVAAIAYLIAAGADVDIGSASKCVGLGSLPSWLDAECEVALVPRAIILGVAAIPVAALIYFAEKDVERTVNWASATGHDIRHDPTKRLYWCNTPGCPFESASRNAAREHRVKTAASQPSGPRSNHRIVEDPRDSMFWCRDCAFWSFDFGAALRHRGFVGPGASIAVAENPGRARPKGQTSGNAYGFGPAPALPRRVDRIEPIANDPTQPDEADAPSPTTTPSLKSCPDCAEEIRFAARKCRFCGYVYEEQSVTSESA